jgi:hypothetical protein
MNKSLNQIIIIQRKFGVVLDEVSSSSPGEVQAVRTLAEYLHKPGKRYGSLEVCVRVRVACVDFDMMYIIIVISGNRLSSRWRGN